MLFPSTVNTITKYYCSYVNNRSWETTQAPSKGSLAIFRNENLTYWWNYKTNKLVDTKNRLVVARRKAREWVKWMKGVKVYELPVIK